MEAMPQIEAQPVPVPKRYLRWREKYGSDFIDRLSGSQVIRPEQKALRKDRLPFFDELDPILKQASSFQLVEFKNGADWRYVVTTQEPVPDREDEFYTVRKVFKRGDKGWIQEDVVIEDKEGQHLDMVDRVRRATHASLGSAFSEELGLDFYTRYQQAGTVDLRTIEDLPNGKELKKLLPRGDVRIRLVDGAKIKDKKAALPTDEDALVKRFGEGFREAYRLAKQNPYNFYSKDRAAIKQLPLNETLHRAGSWSRSDDFYYVEWDAEGEKKYAYVCPQHRERNGLTWDYLEVYTPTFDTEGRARLSLDFEFYKPENAQSEVRESDHYFIIESEAEGKKITQVMRPLFSTDPRKIGPLRVGEIRQTDFENVFIGITDMASGRTLDISRLFPEYVYVSSFNKNKTKGKGNSLHPANAIVYIPTLELPAGGVSLLSRRATTHPAVFGHELGHARQNYEAMWESSDHSKKHIAENNPFAVMYTSLLLPFLLHYTAQTAHTLPEGNMLPLLAAEGVLAGNTLFGKEWMKAEEGAERSALQFIQAAREQGLDLFPGKLDHEIELFINANWWKVLDRATDIITQPRLPLTPYLYTKS